MCTLQEGSPASCQLSFYPLADEKYPETVKQVLKIIEQSKVKFSTNDMSTIISGDADEIFRLLHQIYHVMAEKKCEFVLNVTLSNTCGL